jgi:hypothetical protein
MLIIFIMFSLQAFRKLYEEVGLGWVYAVTKYEPVSRYLQRAKHRLSLVHSLHRLTIQPCAFYISRTSYR